MRDRTARRIVDDVMKTHGPLLARKLDRARANLRDWSGIGQSPNPDGSSRTAGSHGDPTARAAERQVRVVDGKIRSLPPDMADTAAHSLRRLDHHLTRMEYHAAAAVREVEAATNTTTQKGAEGCYPCGQEQHESAWQPIEKRLERPHVRGVTVPYCRWHVEWIEKLGIEPDRAIVAWHLEHPGTAVPRQMWMDHHPQEYGQHLDRLKKRTTTRKAKSDRVGDMGRPTMGEGFAHGNVA